MSITERYRLTSLTARLEGKTLILGFNRPDVVNAINSVMENELYATLRQAENDNDVRVVLLKGEGRLFSAGHDLQQVADEMAAQKPPATIDGRHWVRMGTMLPSWEFTKPLVAAVHKFVGPHANAILMTCDYVIAAEGTRFSFEAAKNSNTGVPFGPYCLMPFYFPMRALKKIWLAGGWFDEQQALDLHYVQRVVPPAELEAEALRHCRYLEQLPHQNQRDNKKGIHRLYESWGLLQMMVLGRDPYFGGPEEQAVFERMMQVIHAQGMGAAARERDANDDESVTRL